jgi:hypothetical protein
VRYEVVLIRVQKEHTWPTGVTTPEKEAYPGSTSWGRFGHTCFTLPEAQALADKRPCLQARAFLFASRYT